MKKVSKKQLAETALAASRSFYVDQTANIDTFRTHDELLKANIFKEVSAITYVERLLSDALISDQSKKIARKLSEGGFDPYLPNDNQVSMIGLVSGAVFRFSPYRNINLIPEVAQRNRQPLLQEFDLFLKEHPKIRRYARYMVVTSGERFKIYHFAERLKHFNKQLGRYFEMSSKAGIDVILCSIEFTVDEENTINLHANIVSAPRRAFGPNGWSDWLKLTRRHFDGQTLHDAGRVKDTKEIIKYVCKFNEIAGLSSNWLIEIAHALYKKQLVRPLGLFREFRKDLKARGQKVRFDNENKELVRCQVCQRTKPESAEDFTKEDILDEAAQAAAAERLALASRYDRLDEKEKIENQIICKTLPQSRATLNGEPFVVVMNYEAQPSTRNGRDGLDAIESRRAFHFRLLAEAGVEVEDLSDVGASNLDTLTIIPKRFIADYMNTDSKRRQKLNSLLGLFDKPTLEAVEMALSDALEQHFPREYHDWSIDVEDSVKLLENGRKRHEEWKQQTEVGRAMYREYKASLDDEFFDSSKRNAANDNILYQFDELDFAIPY
ncbi:hypothetical protein CES85_3995 [Ochrobactrum quorumnocens]|uniref:Uncharacterized protein n=1 Tax=Ochrobactrum quorumnocens TaxID=271865 RepID=A0A248U983_9HYPH|nr:hypothetical protein [[Ochrobactrum] quorumnocens]ASV83216.1 hypothetical protein CES85_3995 [[Ochrobactrum] quorumnocens]